MLNFNKRTSHLQSQPNLIRSFILYVVIPGGLAILAVHTLFPDVVPPDDPVSYALLLRRAGLDERAENHLRQFLPANGYNLVFHRIYQEIYFESISSSSRSETGDDDRVQEIYERLLSTATEEQKDNANYLLGLFWSHRGDSEKALKYFQRVQDPELPFLNNSLGHLFYSIGRHQEALPFFFKGLNDRYSIEASVQNLSNSLLAMKNWSELEKLVTKEQYAQFVPRNVQQTLYLHQGNYRAYISNHFKSFIIHPNWAFILIALSGGILWFWVIRWWDLYEKEPLITSTFVVLAGAFFSHFVFVVRNILDLVLNVEISGNPLNDFLYCVLVIGLVEEVIKFLPVFLVRIFTKKINEPIDWLVYGCLSALGFAVWENYGYLTTYGSSVALPRTFLSLPFHLFLSGTIAVFVAEAPLRNAKPTFMFFMALCLSSLAHGVFDFMLIGPWDVLKNFAFFFVIYFAFFFLFGMTNIQAASPFKNVDREKAKYTPWIFRCFFAIWLLIYFVNSLNLPHELSTTIFLTQDLVPNLGIIWSISIYSTVTIKESWDRDWFKKIFGSESHNETIVLPDTTPLQPGESIKYTSPSQIRFLKFIAYLGFLFIAALSVAAIISHGNGGTFDVSGQYDAFLGVIGLLILCNIILLFLYFQHSVNVVLNSDHICLSWDAYRLKKKMTIAYGDIRRIEIKTLSSQMVIHCNLKRPIKISGTIQRNNLSGLSSDTIDRFSHVNSTKIGAYMLKYDIEAQIAGNRHESVE